MKVRALSVFAGKKQLMGPVDFELKPGSTLVIMGETGAGKSLIAQALIGTLPTKLWTEGEITINGQRVDQLSKAKRSELWGREISILPQEPWRSLDPLMRSFLQVKETYQYVSSLQKAEAVKATNNAFSRLELSGSEQRLPGELSGGMAQRVAFAAATAAKATILLADEPTKGLDATRHTKVIDLLANLTQKGGSLLVITHEVSVARRLGGELMVLREGTLVEQGLTESVLENPCDDYTLALIKANPQSWPSTSRVELGEILLSLRNLAIARGGQRLFEDFSLDVRESEKIAITGPSGIGKTTLIDTMAGILKPAAGTVSHSQLLPNYGIQKLYQDPPAAFPKHVPLCYSLRDVALKHKTDWSDVLQFFDQLGIELSMLNRRPDEVSGGELQRIAIARALSVKPKILLADEPTSRLDPITQRETLEMLSRIADKEQIAIVLVTHDQNIAKKWADREISLT